MSDDNDPFSTNIFEDLVPEKYKESEVNKEENKVVNLTKDQKDFLLKNYDKMDLMDMVRKIFNNEDLDGRSREGRAARKFLAKNGVNYQTSKHKKRESIDLSSDQKEYIKNHCELINYLELAKNLFNDRDLHQFSKEAMSVKSYIIEIRPELMRKETDKVDSTYRPPKSVKGAVSLVNEYTSQTLEEEKLNIRGKKGMEKLLEYLRSPRLVQTITNLSSGSERRIFESEFVRAVWDKGDLTSDELNLYINLVNEYIIQDRIQKIIARLNSILQEITDDPEGKLSMTLSDSIKVKSDEYNSSVNRQKSLVNDLVGKRSSRMELNLKANKSLAAVIEAFRDEEERKNMIRLAELRKEAVKDQMQTFEDMDEWEARIFGIDKDEILD